MHKAFVVIHPFSPTPLRILPEVFTGFAPRARVAELRGMAFLIEQRAHLDG